jgi:aerobic carbon-monoxide dehydrogenase medium subunit
LNHAMLLREVEYARPATVEEAVSVLAAHDGARALAGGQTLINVMKARAADPDVLVDLGDLDELRAIGFSSDGMLEIGAMVTYAQLMGSSEVDVSRPVLAEVAATIGDVQVRNRGTVGGNVCVSDPTNHLPPLLVALGATFTIRGQGGERTVPADEFFLGVYMTAVGEGELLTKVNVPPSSGMGDGFAGLTIGKHGTYIVNAAASVAADTARIAIGCVAASPVRATAMEERLAGGDFSEEAVRAAAEGLGASLDPPSDVHGSADFRRHLAEVSAVRAVLQAAERRKS